MAAYWLVVLYIIYVSYFFTFFFVIIDPKCTVNRANNACGDKPEKKNYVVNRSEHGESAELILLGRCHGTHQLVFYWYKTVLCLLSNFCDVSLLPLYY